MNDALNTTPPIAATPSHDQTVAAPLTYLRTPLILLGLGLIALVPRVWHLNDFHTIDEAYHWIMRVRLFTQALQNGDWGGTNLTGHPGVVTMWLGSIGRWLATQAGVGEPGYGDGALYMSYLRLPMAITNVVVLLLGYLTLRRLVQPSVALLGAFFWATSPFIIAHSRLLHLDAMVTSWMTLSVLLTLIGVLRSAPQRRNAIFSWALIGSGVCAGLAFLTKGPALVLLPAIGLLLFAFSPIGGFLNRLRWSVSAYLIWLVCAVAVIFALWPAMWVAPIATVNSVIQEVIGNGGQPHAWGNYFMGRVVDDPGPLFYPVVVLFRNTPLTLLGLLLLPLALRRTGAPRTKHQASRTKNEDHSSLVTGWSIQQRTLLGLAGYAILFLLAVSVGGKKFDRYLLPIWPATEILAAAGLITMWRLIWSRLAAPRWITTRSIISAVAIVVIGAIALVRSVYYQPYYLAYFNPLLGGGATAQRIMLVGWGEGLEEVGAWLSQRPDIGYGSVLSWIPPTLTPFVPQQVDDLTEQTMRGLSSYAVLYTRSAQKDDSAIAEAYVEQTPALFTVKRYGIDYASVHQLPRPFDQAVDAIFGTGLHLRGFSQQRDPTKITITPSWNVQASQPANAFMFLHVIGSDGQRVAQADLPLDDGMFPQWQAGQQFGRPIDLPLPAALPAGTYRVVLGLYQPSDGARLPLTQGTALPDAIDGPGAIELLTFEQP